jgi:hypothetical protein
LHGCDSIWLKQNLQHLLRGNDAEDDFVVFGLRVRAPGLTHTVPAGRSLLRRAFRALGAGRS